MALTKKERDDIRDAWKHFHSGAFTEAGRELGLSGLARYTPALLDMIDEVQQQLAVAKKYADDLALRLEEANVEIASLNQDALLVCRWFVADVQNALTFRETSAAALRVIASIQGGAK